MNAEAITSLAKWPPITIRETPTKVPKISTNMYILLKYMALMIYAIAVK